MADSLLPRYRRLLRSYPPGPRREELLDTLMQCAPADRRRPTVREAVNLLGHGARARLGRPGRPSVVLVAVLVALAVGYLGAAAAARLSWQFAPPLPSGAAAAQVSATVFPDMTVWGGGDAALFIARADGEGARYGFADYWVTHTPATRDVKVFTEGAAQRLRAAGWRVHGDVVSQVGAADPAIDRPEQRSATFWASRGELHLEFSDVHGSSSASADSDGVAAFQLWRAEPPWVPVAAGVGGLLGVVVGWWLTGWVSRRMEPVPAAGPWLAAATSLAVILPLPTVVFASGGGDRPDEPFWAGLLDVSLLTMLSGLLVAVVLLVAAVQRPPSRPRWLWWSAGGRRRRWAAGGAAGVLVVAVGCYAWLPAGCVPADPAGGAQRAGTALSRRAGVFVSAQSTPELRDRVEAGIGRTFGTMSATWHGDRYSERFRDMYCVSGAASAALPSFFEVDLSSPGVFPALAAQVGGLPGVVAVQRVPDDD